MARIVCIGGNKGPDQGLILQAQDAQSGEEIELILGKGRLRCRVLECRDDSEGAL